MFKSSEYIVFAVFAVVLLFNMGFLYRAQSIQAKWANVPPAPSASSASYAGLGDKEFAYRSYGLMIQNLGDIGGRDVSLNAYNYKRLADWFYYMNALDPKSNYIPFLAAYYFGGSGKPDGMAAVTDYLVKIGDSTEGDKWQWLAQAVFIARYKEKNLPKALDLAHKLAALYHDGMPAWTLQMPALVESAMGDKKAAYDIMMGILKNDADNMDPTEVNFMIYYICERILDEKDAAQHPLCKKEIK